MLHHQTQVGILPLLLTVSCFNYLRYLYNLLSEKVISKNCPALLVACNKQGLEFFNVIFVFFVEIILLDD